MTFLHVISTSAHIAFEAQAHDQSVQPSLATSIPSLVYLLASQTTSVLCPLSSCRHPSCPQFLMLPSPTPEQTAGSWDYHYPCGGRGWEVSQGGRKCCSQDSTSALTAVLLSRDTLSKRAASSELRLRTPHFNHKPSFEKLSNQKMPIQH